MTRRQRCPRCRYTRTWIIRREKRRCARCRYEWRPGLPLRLTRHQWRALLRCHVRGLSAAAIAEDTDVHRQRVLRALIRLRAGMQREVPTVFQGTVEIDETYVGGFWRIDAPANGLKAGSAGEGRARRRSSASCAAGGRSGPKSSRISQLEPSTLSFGARSGEGPSCAPTPCPPTRASLPRATSTAWCSMNSANSVVGRAPTSTAWRASGAT